MNHKTSEKEYCPKCEYMHKANEGHRGFCCECSCHTQTSECCPKCYWTDIGNDKSMPICNNHECPCHEYTKPMQKPTQTSKEHHTYCEKCGRTSNTVDMFNSCPFCTQTLSTVLEEQKRLFEKIVDDILIDMCTNPDCPDPKEHAQYKPIIKMRILESAIASNRTVIEKVIALAEGMKRKKGTDDYVLSDQNAWYNQAVSDLQAELRESIK